MYSDLAGWVSLSWTGEESHWETQSKKNCSVPQLRICIISQCQQAGLQNRKVKFSVSRNPVISTPLSFLRSPHGITLGQSYTSSVVLGADITTR